MPYGNLLKEAYKIKPSILGKKPENLLKCYTKKFLSLFQSLFIETKLRLVHKSLTNMFMANILDFRYFFKENSGLPSDVDRAE